MKRNVLILSLISLGIFFQSAGMIDEITKQIKAPGIFPTLEEKKKFLSELEKKRDQLQTALPEFSDTTEKEIANVEHKIAHVDEELKQQPDDEFLIEKKKLLAMYYLLVVMEALTSISCQIVAGSANNQCLRADNGDDLQQRGIVYAPDFVINAEGLLNVAMALAPEGYSEAMVGERRYRIGKTTLAGGRSIKLVAWELGGPDYISLNVYRLTAGDRLKPCAMAEAKVRAFVLNLAPLRDGTASTTT